jgi:hypothetical protein
MAVLITASGINFAHTWHLLNVGIYWERVFENYMSYFA